MCSQTKSTVCVKDGADPKAALLTLNPKETVCINNDNYVPTTNPAIPTRKRNVNEMITEAHATLKKKYGRTSKKQSSEIP